MTITQEQAERYGFDGTREGAYNELVKMIERYGEHEAMGAETMVLQLVIDSFELSKQGRHRNDTPIGGGGVDP